VLSQRQKLHYLQNLGLGLRVDIWSQLLLDEHVQDVCCLELQPESRAVNEDFKKLYKALDHEQLLLDILLAEPEGNDRND
jgi:hypothetical protein